MSRIVVDGKRLGVKVIFGLDRVPEGTAWFVQIYDRGRPDTEFKEIYLPECSSTELINLLNEYADLTDPYAQACFDMVCLDMDPGLVVKNTYTEAKYV